MPDRPVREPSGARTTGTSAECSSSLATVPRRWRPRRPPLAAPTTMYEAPNSPAAARRPSANDSAKRTCVAWANSIRNLLGCLCQPRLGLLLQIAVVARVRRRDDAAVVGGEHDDEVQCGAGCQGQPRTEGDGVLARVGRGVADDDATRSRVGLLDDVRRRRSGPCGSRRRRAGSRLLPCRCRRSGSGRPRERRSAP